MLRYIVKHDKDYEVIIVYLIEDVRKSFIHVGGYIEEIPIEQSIPEYCEENGLEYIGRVKVL